ncbi:unnamed protein product [Discosporangium mesarthrocarpum]
MRRSVTVVRCSAKLVCRCSSPHVSASNRSLDRHGHILPAPDIGSLARASTASGPPCQSTLYAGHVPTTPLQRVAIAGYAATSALLNPERADMVAALGEMTGRVALERLYRTMLADPEGRKVLQARPVINEATVDLPALAELPNGTLGRAYSDFMGKHGFSPDSRSRVHYVDDPDLAYVMQRYREVHDLWHVLSGLPPTVEAELALKWFEMVQTGLPVCALSAIGVGVKVSTLKGSQQVLSGTYIPWALRAGRKARPLVSVWYEKRWGMGMDEVRKELAMEPAPPRPQQHAVDWLGGQRQRWSRVRDQGGNKDVFLSVTSWSAPHLSCASRSRNCVRSF